MENQKIIECIVRGMEYYTETLAIPPHMESYNDGICAWIKPKDGETGPSCVYKVNFGDKTDEEIRGLIQSYREKGAPDAWFVTPLSTPNNVREILLSLGLMNPEDADMNDQGMAIPPEQMADVTARVNDNLTTTVKKVDNKEDFKTWCSIANGVLHGGQLLVPDHYYSLCESGKMVCFLGYCGEIPVATSATMNNDGNATLEFIATLPDYRKKGMGTMVCRAAIDYLINDGASVISLRAREIGVSLYKSLGFRVYFDF